MNNRAKKTIPKVCLILFFFHLYVFFYIYQKFHLQTNPVDCDRFIYKCRRCQVGFKRRGMLVNHLAKRHPDVPPESVPELCLPILRQTRDYYCQYCDKVSVICERSTKKKAINITLLVQF